MVLKLRQRFKSKARNVYTEEINKIALSSNDDKRLHTFDQITSYLYDTNVRKAWKTEQLQYLNIKRLILLMLLMKIRQNTIQNGCTFLTIHTE